MASTVRTIADQRVTLGSCLARVLAQLGLPHDENRARFPEPTARFRSVSHAQMRQPVNARGLGGWNAYAGALAAWPDTQISALPDMKVA